MERKIGNPIFMQNAIKITLHYLTFILINLVSLHIHLIFSVPLSPVSLLNGFKIHMIFECTIKYQTDKYLSHG